MSTLVQKLNHIKGTKEAIKDALVAKGVEVKAEDSFRSYAEKLRSIETGVPKVDVFADVLFIDFDGTPVKSYTKEEALALASLPSPPDHSDDDIPLVFDGWNWTVDEIKASVSIGRDVLVGANYHTADDKTHIIFEVNSDGDPLGVMVGLSATRNMKIDWGDGTSTTSPSTINTHVYASKGVYDCVVEGEASVSTSTATDQYYNRHKATKIRCSRFQTTLPNGAFYNEYSLGDISIPQTLATVNATSVRGCYGISAVVIPRGCSFSGMNIFVGNESLKYISFPDAISFPYTFGFEHGIARITLPKDNSFESSRCQEFESLRRVYVPSAVAILPTNAFYFCQALRSVILAEGVSKIGENAFNQCRCLDGVELPSTLTEIASGAFANCNALGILRFKSQTPPTLSSSNSLDSTYIQKIVVPRGSLSAYQSATNFSRFASKMEESND